MSSPALVAGWAPWCAEVVGLAEVALAEVGDYKWKQVMYSHVNCSAGAPVRAV